MEIKLVKTCDACPEQYDAYLGDRKVGHLRLRHGYFCVEFPHCGGETVLEGYPNGDGLFDPRERDYWLNAARKAIARKIEDTQR